MYQNIWSVRQVWNRWDRHSSWLNSMWELILKCDAITRNLKWITQNKSSKESARIEKWGMRLPTCFQHILEGSFLPTFFGQPLVYVQSASKHGFSRTSPHWPAQISRVDWNSVRFFCLMSRVLKHLCCCMSVARKNDPPQIDHGVPAATLLNICSILCMHLHVV